MFIELAEFLRCPIDHAEQTFCVLLRDEVRDRDVRSGLVGCPICKREYPVVEGVVWFDPSPARVSVHPDAADALDPATVQALLGLTTPGGYVVVVGSAGVLAEALATLLAGVHVVAVNPPDIRMSSAVSVLRSRDRIPLRDSMARGVVVGAESSGGAWLGESERILLGGLRMVVCAEGVSVEGVEQLAEGNGTWVGRKERQ